MVWATLLTNLQYLPGVLTLDFALKMAKTKYPFVVLYTDSLEQDAHIALDKRSIPKQRVEFLLPKGHDLGIVEERFLNCWSKLTPFSMTQYERIILLDSDMLVIKNMDELMDLPISLSSSEAFASSHAYVCNSVQKEAYPEDWIPENCAYTSQHSNPTTTSSTTAAHNSIGLECNSGLLVIPPSKENYQKVIDALAGGNNKKYGFADQSLLSDVFKGRWVPLPYIYNALKTLRKCHKEIWNDLDVKNAHYILSPKP